MPHTKFPRLIAALTSALLVLCALPASSQERAAEPPPLFTDDRADAILEELKQIRSLLEKLEKQGLAQKPKKPKPPATATLQLDPESPSLGATDAPITVVEFTDFQCPYCKRFVETSFPNLKRDYVDTGKVRWVARDLPLKFHPNARKAAQAAHCAGEQGRYWEMRDTLFRNNRNLAPEQLIQYAAPTGIDPGPFADCLASERYLERIDRDAQLAQSIRVTGTPTFVIGKPKGLTLSGKRVVGAKKQAVFSTEFDRLLKSQDKP
jgi:protein-disulfide isomerase